MSSDLLKFLYSESQSQAVLDLMLEDESVLVRLLELAKGEEKLEINATPLVKALKQVLDLDGELDVGVDGVKLKVCDQDTYNSYRAKLNQPDVVAKLAELGWVVFYGGDVNSSDEPGCWVLKFLELNTADTEDEKGYKDQAAFDKAMRASAEKSFSTNPKPPQGTYGDEELPDPKKK